MPQTTTTKVLHGAPLRIWSALTEAEHRRAWAPMVLLDDAAQVGDTECTFVMNGWFEHVRSPAHVDQLDKPVVLAWSCGLRHVFTFHESYHLDGDDGATTLSHICSVRGPLSLPFAAVMLRRMRVLMSEADERLAAYLRWRTGRSGPGPERRQASRRYRGAAR
ncbi:SRPBCC domain-containing protein [Sphingomonas sp. RHCKR7]|nr:SRPBCC domain-containing protein [Sphingomonas folli]